MRQWEITCCTGGCNSCNNCAAAVGLLTIASQSRNRRSSSSTRELNILGYKQANTVSRKRLRSFTGFSRTSSTPRRNALAISAIFSVAEITRIGVWSPRLRKFSTSLRPFILGIAISHIMRSGVKRPINSRASTPSPANAVVAPKEENHESRSERNTGSSSTIRICFPTNGCVMFSPLTGFNQ